MVCSSVYPGYIINDDKIVRLTEGREIEGVLEDLVDGPIGLIIVTISGTRVELPRMLKRMLKPLMGQHMKVAFLAGRYHVARCRRQA